MAQNNRKRTNNRKRRAPRPLPAPLPPSAPQQDNEVTAIFRECNVSEINHRIRTEPVKCLIKGMYTIPKAEELLAAQKVALPIHLNLKKMIDDGQVLGEDLAKVYERMESYEGLIKRTEYLEESIPFLELWIPRCRVLESNRGKLIGDKVQVVDLVDGPIDVQAYFS